MLQSLTSKEARFLRLTPSHADVELKKRTVRGLTASITGEGIIFVLRVASIGILARLLIPEYFGLITMVMVVTSIVERLKDLGLANATIQRKTITHEEVSTLFWINAAGGLVMALAVAACAYPLALFYGDQRLIPITLVLATTFIWSSLAIQHQALLNRQMKYGQLAMIQISAEALSLGIAVVMALNGAGYWALVAREGLRSVFYTAATWLCMPWLPGRPSRCGKVMSMLRFGGDVTAFNLVVFFCSNVDKILIGRLMGATVLGLYRQGSQLALLPSNQLMYPINNVAQSILSRLQDQPERYRRSYTKLLTALTAVTMPSMMFLAVFATEILLLVLGQEWLEAVNILRILALASFIESVSSTAGSVTLTCGQSRKYLLMGIFSSLGSVAFLVAGIPWGAEGIATGRLASALLLTVPLLWWCFRDTPVTLKLVFDAVSRPFLSSLLMGEVLYVWKVVAPSDSAVATVLFGGLLAAPLYLGVWLLLPSGRSELRKVWKDLFAAFGRSKGGTITV